MRWIRKLYSNYYFIWPGELQACISSSIQCHVTGVAMVCRQLLLPISVTACITHNRIRPQDKWQDTMMPIYAHLVTPNQSVTQTFVISKLKKVTFTTKRLGNSVPNVQIKHSTAASPPFRRRGRKCFSNSTGLQNKAETWAVSLYKSNTRTELISAIRRA